MPASFQEEDGELVSLASMEEGLPTSDMGDRSEHRSEEVRVELAAFSANAPRSLSSRCRLLMDKLADESPTRSCTEVLCACGKKSGQWLYAHKGTIILVFAFGVACFYVGTRVAKMSSLCDAAIDECGTAVKLLHTCTQKVEVLGGVVQRLVGDGTQDIGEACSQAVHECATTANTMRETYAMCKLCNERLPAPVP
jgi:hypothetical protein